MQAVTGGLFEERMISATGGCCAITCPFKYIQWCPKFEDKSGVLGESRCTSRVSEESQPKDKSGVLGESHCTSEYRRDLYQKTKAMIWEDHVVPRNV